MVNITMNKKIFIISFIQYFLIFLSIPYISWFYSSNYDNYILSNYDKFDTYVNTKILSKDHSSKIFLPEKYRNCQFENVISNRYYSNPDSFLMFNNIPYPKFIIVIEAIKISVESFIHFIIFFMILIFILSLYILPLIYFYLNGLFFMVCLLLSFIISLNKAAEN